MRHVFVDTNKFTPVIRMGSAQFDRTSSSIRFLFKYFLSFGAHSLFKPNVVGG